MGRKVEQRVPTLLGLRLPFRAQVFVEPAAWGQAAPPRAFHHAAPSNPNATTPATYTISMAGHQGAQLVWEEEGNPEGEGDGD